MYDAKNMKVSKHLHFAVFRTNWISSLYPNNFWTRSADSKNSPFNLTNFLTNNQNLILWILESRKIRESSPFNFNEFYDKTIPNLILWILDFLWKSLRKLAEASHMKRYTQTPLQYKLWSFVYLKFLLANLHVIPSTAPKRALLSLLRCKGILFY